LYPLDKLLERSSNDSATRILPRGLTPLNYPKGFHDGKLQLHALIVPISQKYFCLSDPISNHCPTSMSKSALTTSFISSRSQDMQTTTTNIHTPGRGSRPRLPNRYAFCLFAFRVISLLFSIAALAVNIDARNSSNTSDSHDNNPVLYTGIAIALVIDISECLGIGLKRETIGIRRVSPMCVVLLEIVAMILLGLSWLYEIAQGFNSGDAPPSRKPQSSFGLNAMILSIPML
jgi:hypothetical protein